MPASAVTRFSACVAPLDRPNVDTDAIVPKQYLKSIRRTGFGAVLFDEWRYLDAGEPGDDHGKRRQNPDFVLNQSRYRNARILLTRENFGCGSSREHAVWALQEYGFRAVVAPSFADIFATNADNNGLLLIRLEVAVVESLFAGVQAQQGYSLTVDVSQQRLVDPAGHEHSFALDAVVRRRLLHGLDRIGEILRHREVIRAYEQRRSVQVPWLFPDAT